MFEHVGSPPSSLSDGLNSKRSTSTYGARAPGSTGTPYRGQMDDHPTVRALADALRSWHVLLDGIDTADLALATVNPGWSVGDVINHAIAVTAKFTAFADGTTDRPRTAGRDFIGTGHRAAWGLAADRALTAWRSADPRRHCRLPFGTFTAQQAAGINLFDLLAHGWDLHQATGATFTCTDAAWTAGLDAARLAIGTQRDLRHYAPEIPAPSDAPPQTRLLNYLGRRPT